LWRHVFNVPKAQKRKKSAGIVTNGVVIPNSSLPEGATVEILLRAAEAEGTPGATGHLTAAELLKLPRAERQSDSIKQM
jgi:hypothetical protein